MAWTNAAFGAVFHYVDWQAADAAEGTASGIITLPDDSVVTVAFVATNSDGSAGTLYGAQIDGGTNYWAPDAPYVSGEVENAPPDTDILQLSGGLDQTYEVTLSEPIKDPVMAIVSLGAAGTRTTYDFDSPFEIVSQGAGYWGGSDTALTVLPDDVLEGYEGHGTLRFIGTFSTFSWTVPTPESWHGFTFAIRTTEAIEPTPVGEGGAGGADGAGGEGSGGTAGANAGEGGVAGIAADAGAGGEAVDDGGAAGSGPDVAGRGGSGGVTSPHAGSGGVVHTPEAGAGGDDDDRDSGGERGRCHCSAPGAESRSLGSSASMLALAACAILRRKRRR